MATNESPRAAGLAEPDEPTADRAASASSRLYWIRTTAYWVFTLMIGWELVAGSLWDVLQLDYVRDIFAYLGYPMYLLTIIGLWKLPGAVTLLLPGFPRLKEWAYAGAFFNYSGAAASHILSGADPIVWLGPLLLAAFTVASWALRPPDRRLRQTSPAAPASTLSWLVSIGLLVVLLATAIATLPVGPPPQWTYGNAH